DVTGATASPEPVGAGSAVAQLFLHADIDRDLTQVGSGDNGGIATLLVRLGDALVADDPAAHDPTRRPGAPRVERVVTMSRGRHEEALSSLTTLSSAFGGHT